MRDPAGGFVPWVDGFHGRLWSDGNILGVTAGHVVGWLGVLFLVDLALGVYIWWWPRARRWAGLLRVRRARGPYSFHLDLHRLTGVFAVPLLAFIVLTGLNLQFGENLRGVWYQLTPGADQGPRALAKPPQSTPQVGGRPIPLADAIAAAQRAVPNSRPASTSGPSGPTGAIAVNVSHGWDPARGPRSRGGNTTVYVDQFSGKVLKVHKPEDRNLANQLYEWWRFPVHAGEFAGVPVRLLWSLAAVTPLVLLGSGLRSWRLRGARRRRRFKLLRTAIPTLSRRLAKLVAARCSALTLKDRRVLVNEGDPAPTMFVVLEGALEVSRGGQVVRTMGPGEHAGEIGMFEGTRTATLVALGQTDVLVLDRPTFELLTSESEETRDRLRAVAEARKRDDTPDS